MASRSTICCTWLAGLRSQQDGCPEQCGCRCIDRMCALEAASGILESGQDSPYFETLAGDETGETGNVICFEILESGKIRAKEVEASAQSTGVNVLRSPAKARKRTFEEVADSEGEDVDEYGWADGDEEALPGSGDETEAPA
ncbi:hypothetical protein KC338_g71 [Hortaea werneckii]|nr:hypothetical protein KC338_g71 [Hortaea werneckii]